MSIKSFHNRIDSEYLSIICRSLAVSADRVLFEKQLYAGMTNRSFVFRVDGEKYIFRVPGEGTSRIINRREEEAVYRVIAGKGIGDEPLYFNADTGYKITKFVDNAHNCNPQDETDVRRCIRFLRDFHQRRLTVAHRFDLAQHIEYYEELMGHRSAYEDYEMVKKNVMSLLDYADSLDKTMCLTHIDAVPDNFLITDDRLLLIDWEYAAMQDPHLDIAMFAVYAGYDRAGVDKLLDIYFDGACPPMNRRKLYCYIAACGLLWSNWCEYKASLGEDFGEYAQRQYRYAKEYYRIFSETVS